MPVSPIRCIVVVLFVLAAWVSTAVAQSHSASIPKKLPSVDKIVSDYLKAIGGKKAAIAQRDTTR
jgi:hypothetical protein